MRVRRARSTLRKLPSKPSSGPPRRLRQPLALAGGRKVPGRIEWNSSHTDAHRRFRRAFDAENADVSEYKAHAPVQIVRASHVDDARR
mmetsp:Transcript_551/g.2241  ORF Transcript_551/g.2241 Transcript_551/m.2241 type:complete len:88 (-) Transcript_551:1931-2194(-)